MKKLLLGALLCGGMAMAQTIELQSFATGFTNPVDIAHAGDGRLFIVEQDGLIKILYTDGTVNPTAFLDVTTLISNGGERGLLGVAFHPEYATNGYFYINYTNTAGNTVIARYTRSITNESVADPESASIILTIDQPFDNHNGGCLRFGPDGYLYIGMGDGGSGGDPNNNAQNINSLLGKMLRIDVDGTAPYSIPEGNPFIGIDGADEIWAIGLRNPWKFSFNRDNGDLWIADVGQNEIEEINKVAGDAAAINYGWRCFEGSEVYNDNGCSLVEMYTPPFTEYTHANNACSVTGGYVYTGTIYTSLQGKYLFADYCNNRIGIANADGTHTFTAPFSGNFSTFGEDVEGELYIAGKNNGTVYKITATMGIDAVNNDVYSLYPNPAKSSFTVNLNAESASLDLYDLGGKILISQQLNSDENTVDTSALQPGIYFVNVSHNNGSNKQKVVIH